MNYNVAYKAVSMPTIRDLRVEKELPQPVLAELAGVSTGTISHMENGKPVSRETLKKVCAVLGVDPSDVDGVNLFIPVKHRRFRKR